ncbi:hypothetical protein FOXYSP1_20135 [Fusarium oxysporum f. sp. phaseoli]
MWISWYGFEPWSQTPPHLPLHYFLGAWVTFRARSVLFSLASRQTLHSPETASLVTFDTNLPHMVAQGTMRTGCSPTRCPHAWQMIVPKLIKHMLVPQSLPQYLKGQIQLERRLCATQHWNVACYSTMTKMCLGSLQRVLLRGAGMGRFEPSDPKPASTDAKFMQQ